VTLKCEKEQVSALAEYLSGLIAKLPTGAVEGERARAPCWSRSSPLGGRGRSAWATTRPSGASSSSPRAGRGREEGDPPAPEPATARFAITRAQATAFVERARTLVKAGRATCSMCGEPKDPAGHVCPRANGHVVHKE